MQRIEHLFRPNEAYRIEIHYWNNGLLATEEK